MGQQFSMDGYVDVAERLQELRKKHPDASLQPASLEKPFDIVTVGDVTFVVYVAACYRTPDDPRPGVGIAWEPVPGRTPYTKNSELQNAETSAWGRAIVAVGAADTKRGVASANEIENRRESPPASKERIDAVVAAAKAAGIGGWVTEQQFTWPYTEETCAAIERQATTALEAPFEPEPVG